MSDFETNVGLGPTLPLPMPMIHINSLLIYLPTLKRFPRKVGIQWKLICVIQENRDTT